MKIGFSNQVLKQAFENPGFKKKPGFRTSLYNFPLGSIIHNISLSLTGNGIFSRSCGSFAKILQKNIKNKYVRIRLSSGEERLVHQYCKATLGIVSDEKKK